MPVKTVYYSNLTVDLLASSHCRIRPAFFRRTAVACYRVCKSSMVRFIVHYYPSLRSDVRLRHGGLQIAVGAVCGDGGRADAERRGSHDRQEDLPTTYLRRKCGGDVAGDHPPLLPSRSPRNRSSSPCAAPHTSRRLPWRTAVPPSPPWRSPCTLPLPQIPADARYAKLQAVHETKSSRPELTTASRVVVGGRGVGSKKQFDEVFALADKLGAAGGIGDVF